MKKIKYLCFFIYLSLFVANLADFQACHGAQQGSMICGIFVFGLSAIGATFLHNKTKTRKFVYAGKIEISERTEREAKKNRFMNFGKWFCVGAAISSVIFMILPGKKAKSGNSGHLPSLPAPAESGNGGCLPPLSPPLSQDPSYLQNFSEPPSPAPSPAPKHVICYCPRRNSWPIASPVRENYIDESPSPSLSPDFRRVLLSPPSLRRDFGRSQSLPRGFGCPPARVTNGTTSPDSLVDWTRRTQ